MKRLLLGGIIVFGLAVSPARAAVRPHGLFSQGAVLQRGMRVPVWGAAADGERVTVSFAGQRASTVARAGQWQVWLRPLPPGGPHTLTIAGENTVRIPDVLVGEVYIASGQSNMEWPMTATEGGVEAIAASGDPMLRLLTIPHATSDWPLSEVSSPWRQCGPDSVARFSAVAYYFAKDLRKALGVPVGIINTSWGGTIAEAWMRRGAIEGDPVLKPLVDNYDRQKQAYPAALRAYYDALNRYTEAAAQAQRDGRTPPPPPAAPPNPNNRANPNRPSVLYNAMIRPLVPYAIRGAIWYQGESNAGRAHQYHTLFPAMIRSWRQDWGQGEFGFYFVQLAPFMPIQTAPQESAWAELREAQRKTALTVPNTGMAVITDVGEERDIHPRKKQPVGSRLALAALAVSHDRDVEHTGPVYSSMRLARGQAVLHFKNVAGGLQARGAKLTGFTIAGLDRKWVNAQAEIRGRDTVVVSSPEVPNPAAVRFGWANFPVVNLWNDAGLPASPFRTDDWPLTTAPR